MRALDDLLAELYVVHERMTRDEIHRAAVAAELPAEEITLLESLPEGEYAEDEVGEALRQLAAPDPLPTAMSTPDHTTPDDIRSSAMDSDTGPAEGIAASQLSDDDLRRELASLHRTREDTLRHGSQQALETHINRTAELEEEYLVRFPDREVDPERLREGARARAD